MQVPDLPQATVKQSSQPEHPAVRAWSALQQRGGKLERVEVIKEESPNMAVYRLCPVGTTGPAIIAKRSLRATAMVERTIYEEFLPHLPCSATRYHGFLEEPESDSCWLFLEEVTGRSYRSHDPQHRSAAARWLGLMNVSASRMTAAGRLPTRQPGHYLGLLHSVRERILSTAGSPAFDAQDRALLGKVIAHCDHLEAQWSELAEVCGEVPQTLVHGDFVAHNVYIRADRDGVTVLPVDWEKAGWGVPAEDISDVDIAAYWSTIRAHWPALSHRNLKLLAKAGKVFRCLVFLDWITARLGAESIGQLRHDVRDCESWLAELIRAGKWRGRHG